MASKGFFVAFEGIDGSGKSTVVARVRDALTVRGLSCLKTQEHQLDRPTGKRIADILEKRVPMIDSFELQKLFVEDRKDHIEHVIQPALEKGLVVLSDRYWFSTLAYGMLTSPLDVLVELHRTIMGDNFLRPDLTIYLDIPATLAIERMRSSRSSLSHFEKLKKLERVRENYLTLEKSNLGPVVTIDATHPPEILAEETSQEILRFLKMAREY